MPTPTSVSMARVSGSPNVSRDRSRSKARATIRSANPGSRSTPEEQAERDADTRLRLRPGASMPSEGALRTSLGWARRTRVPGGDPENLVALARAALARNRQQMLATMVMLGMQRIVIESGRLHASMRFHIDTRSAAADDRGSQLRRAQYEHGVGQLRLWALGR